jgi:hypothetical protein
MRRKQARAAPLRTPRVGLPLSNSHSKPGPVEGPAAPSECARSSRSAVTKRLCAAPTCPQVESVTHVKPSPGDFQAGQCQTVMSSPSLPALYFAVMPPQKEGCTQEAPLRQPPGQGDPQPGGQGQRGKERERRPHDRFVPAVRLRAVYPEPLRFCEVGRIPRGD